MTKTETGSDIFAPQNERISYECEIVHPGTKRGMGFFISLQSVSADEPKRIGKSITNRSQKLARQQKTFNADEIRQNAIDVITACVVGWRWGEDADGKPGSAGGVQLEFNPKNLKLVLDVDYIRNQLDVELNEESNFFPKSV